MTLSATEILERCGIPVGSNFFSLTSEQKGALDDAAKATRYRAPKHRNGSRLRYFHAYLERKAQREMTMEN